MRYTICSQCRTLFSYRRSTCPACGMRHNRKTLQRVKLCFYDGTPMPVACGFCPVCGLDMRRLYIPAWVWPLLLIIVSFMNIWFLGNLRQHIYQTFHPATCIIHSATINTNAGKDATTYFIVWNYTVIGKNGQQLDNGQGRMGLEDNYDSQDDAQQIIDQYHSGGPQSCWYSPIALFNRALLTPPDELVVAPFEVLWLLVPLIAFSLISICVIMMLRSWRLFKYGKSVMGTVVEREVEVTKYGKSIHCIIVFKTQTKPALTCNKRAWYDLRKHQRVEIVYDPLFPTLVARVGSNLTFPEVRLYFILNSLAILLLLGVLGGLVLTAFAF